MPHRWYLAPPTPILAAKECILCSTVAGDVLVGPGVTGDCDALPPRALIEAADSH